MTRKLMKKRAEELAKAELVGEFRKLQKWYNTMKSAVEQLETDHEETVAALTEANRINLILVDRLNIKDELLENQITDSNANKQMLLQRIQQMQMKIHELKKD